MSGRRRTRLSNHDPVGHRTAASGGLVFLALPFLGAGAFFALAGFGFTSLPGEANAPLPVIGCVGLAFFVAGAHVLASGVSGLLHRRRKRRIESMFAGETWLADFPWDPTGIGDGAVSRCVRGWTGVAFLAVFLAPFHWWAWMSGGGGLFVKGIVGLFELILVAVVVGELRRTFALLRHGVTRLRFDAFPFHPGDDLRVTFTPNRFDEPRATLRYVEESWVETGRGTRRRRTQVADALWSEEHVLAPHRLDVALPIRLPLPADPELVNRFSESPVRYWELVLEADVPGPDFRARFLLPVYPPRGD